MSKYSFWIIIGIAVVLRFWQLGNVPPSPDWDEASLGYNAYSIMQTGRDEYGKFLPVILRSFDDYKPGLYAYLVIPFIRLIDLNIIAVRLPSAIFGVLAVTGTYLLVKELFKKSHLSLQDPASNIALLTSLLLAISPWHLQFSRIAFEAQVGLSLNIFSVLFFLKGLKRGIYLIPSVMFAAASIYMYQSEKVYLPILFLVLLAIYWKDFIKVSKRWIVGAVLVGILLSIPIVYGMVSDPNSLLRAKGVSSFADQTQFLKRNVIKYADDVERGDFLGMLVDNRRVEYTKAVVAGYISHFNFNWLFITGDIERHHAPNMGLLYLFELPLLLMGIYQLAFGNFSKKTKLTIFAIFLIAPIPASITSGVPHAVRTINFLPTFQIFTALGLIAVFNWISSIKYEVLSIKYLKLRIILYTFFFILSSFNIMYFLNQYFVQQNYYYSESWQYGWEQAVEFIKPIESKYTKVVVTNDRPLDQSYMFFLYYLKYDPKKYLDGGGTRTGGFKEEHRFGKYEFRYLDWEKDSQLQNAILVGTPEEIPADAPGLVKEVKFLDGKIAFRIVARE